MLFFRHGKLSAEQVFEYATGILQSGSADTSTSGYAPICNQKNTKKGKLYVKYKDDSDITDSVASDVHRHYNIK